MSIGRTTRLVLGIVTGVILAFIYIPIALIFIYSFNSGTTPAWPPVGFTLALFPVERAQTLGGAVMVAVGSGLMVTFCEPLLVQPLAVTVTFRVVVPVAPAVKVMVSVLVALVIVPLVIDHAYVAPP